MSGVSGSGRYPIPAEEWRVEIRASNSRFIATAGYVPSVAAARSLISQVRDTFPDASHHVYGYLVGYGASVTAGMSDDGEPSGTAGRPVLAVVRGSGLGDICVVVTRYFGGTLLGTGGLVHAYGDAAKAVLAELPRTEKVARVILALAVPYDLYDTVKRLIETDGATILEQNFGVNVALRVRLDEDRATAFQRTISEATAGRVQALIADDETEAALL